jgi:hypothetical protein
MATIAELLLARGAQDADARRRAGKITGNSYRHLADLVSQTGRDIAQQQATAPQRALQGIALQKAQQEQAGTQVLDSALKPYTPNGPQEEGATAAPQQHPYLDDQTGLYDTQKLSGVLAANGMGHLAPDLLKGVESINDSITKHQKAEQDLANATTVMYGDLANGVLTLKHSTGMPIDQAMDLVAQPALNTKRLNPQQYQQIKTQLVQLPPAQQDAALSSYMDAAAKIAPDKDLGKDAKRLDRYNRETASNVVAPTPTRASIALAAANGDPTAAMNLLAPPKAPGATAEADDNRYRNIQASIKLGQSVSPQDAAWAQGYEKQKTLGVDLTAGMASNRQATAIAANTAQQQRAQKFQEQQQGRKELTEKVEQPYQTAASSAQTLRDTVALAKTGNMSAAALQNLETTMAAIRAQGLNRINTTEIGSTADAGSLWDRIQSKFGKVTAGQPVDPALQKDMQQFAGLLERAAYKKYLDGQTSVTKRYGLTDEKPLAGPTIYARDPQGNLHSAPYGQPLPNGWTEE